MLPSKITVALVLMLTMLPQSAQADFWTLNGCILPAPIFENGGFRFDEKTGKAQESLKLGESVTLWLEHSRCEYVNWVYIFVLKEAPDDTNVAGWQYRKAIELLSLLEAHSNPKQKLANEK
jgi:hypothetical protein